jgi:hypothetical protein
MGVYPIALMGMRSAQQGLFEAAKTIASGTIDLYAEGFVQMARARHAQAANIKVIETQRRMDDALLDIVA